MVSLMMGGNSSTLSVAYPHDNLPFHYPTDLTHSPLSFNDEIDLIFLFLAFSVPLYLPVVGRWFTSLLHRQDFPNLHTHPSAA